jgi:hypothetical protein
MQKVLPNLIKSVNLYKKKTWKRRQSLDVTIASNLLEGFAKPGILFFLSSICLLGYYFPVIYINLAEW